MGSILVMIFYKDYEKHNIEIRGKKNKFDNSIYTFDIETTSYLILDNKIIPACLYEELSEKDRKRALKQSCMYIWQLSINDKVYYGRTWEQLKDFFSMLFDVVPQRKIIFIHNLSFEFQYLFTQFLMSNVMARKSRKVMKAYIDKYNIEFRCTLYMTNCKLEKLPKTFLLPVEKQVGSLNYNLIRHTSTPLTEQEMKYCEYDCLVVYEYIKKELLTYETVDKIPITSTGHVRRELKKLVEKDYKYKNYVRRSINTSPHIYNLLVDAFQGGYTHACYIYTDIVMKDVDSWDFTSSYPYVMVTHKFPSTEFKICRIKKYEDMSFRFAYLLIIKMKNIKSRCFNTFLSLSKCRHVKKGIYDNGRIISAEELETTITDVDFRILKESYDFDYEIIESYYSVYRYLPKQLINFILDKYVTKTEYKDVEGLELEYSLEKAKFNAIFGMSVTNTIRDNVKFDGRKWSEEPLTNEEIKSKLDEEKNKGFLSFSYGCWVTAWGRYNLLKNVIKNDSNGLCNVIYCDTDSMKLRKGYDKKVIEDYNNFVENKIKKTSDILDIPISKFSPKDKKGIKHTLGLFEQDGHYLEFITQGAKKYAVKCINKDTGLEEIKITVAGVPKKGAKALHSLDDFRDNFIFNSKDTDKMILEYNDNQKPVILTDYLGNEELVTDKSGCCLLPASYTLGKSLEYANLLMTDTSSARARYNEEVFEVE